MSDSQSANKHTTAPLGNLLRFAVAGLSVTWLFTLFAGQFWLADILANLRVQQIIAITIVLALCLAMRQWAAVVCAFGLIVIHLPWMSFAYLDAREVATAGTPMTVTVSNARTSNQRHTDVIQDLIARDPDVIAVLEVSTALADKLKNDLSVSYPFATAHPQDHGNFGIALFSRIPMENVNVFSLNLERVPSIEATIRHDGHDYLIVATHPIPPRSRQGYESRNEHLVQLARRIKSNTNARHRILVGDLNVTPWSPIYADFLEHAGLSRAQVGWNVTPTWYRGPGFPFALVLDHGLVSKNIRCVSHQVGPDVGSDHRSVTIKVAPVKR